MRMSPASGSIIRLIMRIVVVLPQPDGPISTQISPAPMAREMSSTAGDAAPGKRLVRCSISITPDALVRRASSCPAEAGRRDASPQGAEREVRAKRQQGDRDGAD